MLNWLLRLWRKIGGLTHPRPALTTYHPSNLHGRHRQGDLAHAAPGRRPGETAIRSQVRPIESGKSK
jgi:hypothetical protein